MEGGNKWENARDNFDLIVFQSWLSKYLSNHEYVNFASSHKITVPEFLNQEVVCKQKNNKKICNVFESEECTILPMKMFGLQNLWRLYVTVACRIG